MAELPHVCAWRINGLTRPSFPKGLDLWAAALLRRRAIRLGGQRGRTENKQGVAGARSDGVGLALLVAEFDKRGGFVQRLDDSTDLTSDEPVLRKVAEKRDGAEEIAPWIA
jgi:hypothetical protein